MRVQRGVTSEFVPDVKRVAGPHLLPDQRFQQPLVHGRRIAQDKDHRVRPRQMLALAHIRQSSQVLALPFR